MIKGTTDFYVPTTRIIKYYKETEQIKATNLWDVVTFPKIEFADGDIFMVPNSDYSKFTVTQEGIININVTVSTRNASALNWWAIKISLNDVEYERNIQHGITANVFTSSSIDTKFYSHVGDTIDISVYEGIGTIIAGSQTTNYIGATRLIFSRIL